MAPQDEISVEDLLKFWQEVVDKHNETGVSVLTEYFRNKVATTTSTAAAGGEG